jgi:hypothetical protein
MFSHSTSFHAPIILLIQSLNTAIKWITNLFHIHHVPISNSRSQTSCHVWLVTAFLSPRRQCRIALEMRPQPLPSTCFRIHRSLIILSFDGIQPEHLIEILNKPYIKYIKIILSPTEITVL